MTPAKTFVSEPRLEATEEFIQKNNLKLRSEDEIVGKWQNETKDDILPFNFRNDIFLQFLPYEKCKPFLSNEFKEQYEANQADGSQVVEWKQIINVQEAAQDFLDYMNFAWGKAEDQRGLSASRSIQKLSAWLWLMNREDLSNLIEDDNLYNPYGAPALIAVCNEMGIEVPESLVTFASVKV